MGYETRMHVVAPYNFETDPPTGQELAMIDLCKCGYDGPLATLIQRHTKNRKEYKGKVPFALYSRNPDRQHEAVEFLRGIAELEDLSFLNDVDLPHDKEGIEKLAADIEDGCITKDCYGDYLGVMDIDDVIGALEEELKRESPPYRRFVWALSLLKSIKNTWPEGNLKVVTYGH